MGKKKKASETDGEAAATRSEEPEEPEQKEEKKIVDDGKLSVTKEHVEEFLRKGTSMMMSEEVRSKLKEEAPERPGQRLIEFQRSNWDSMGINRDVGCAVLDHIEHQFPGDTALVQLRTDFIKSAQYAYLQALQDRRPAVLECSAPMPRTTIVEFFDACNTVMQTDEMHLKLMAHLKQTGEMPNKLIIEAQRDCLEMLGFDKDHGCRCLSKIGQDFPGDTQLQARYKQWHDRAQAACMRAVKEHQMSGGQLPNAAFNVSPEMQKWTEPAKKAVEQMTPQERTELIQKMHKKVMVFMNLPPEGRKRYVEGLSEDDKLEFVKGQLLLVSKMQNQWKQQQGQSSSQQQEPSSSEQQSPSASAELTASPTAPAEFSAAPQQMSM